MDSMVKVIRELPRDLATGLVCQISSMIISPLMYKYLTLDVVSPTYRHLFVASIGIIFTTLLYSRESINILLMVLMSFYLITHLPAGKRGWPTFAYSVSHVLAVHLNNYIFHYMQFPLEVSNSLMILAMKASFTAFSLDDFPVNTANLSPQRHKYKLKSPPNLFEYFCYQYCFLGILFGPAYHFSEYQSFINGDQNRSPWPLKQALRTLLTSFLCLFLYFMLEEHYNIRVNLLETYMTANTAYRHLVLWLTMLVSRCKYYFVWLSSEACCYFAGLGYRYGSSSGLSLNNNQSEESDDKSEWTSDIRTVEITNIEFPPCLKVFTDSWNIFTARWLQFCIFERVETYRMLKVFVVSATWHGFYLGYYVMFGSLGLATLLGRKIRRVIRPAFQASRLSRLLYDVITTLATIGIIAFNSVAFELKDFASINKLHGSLYYYPHILVVLGLILIPNGGRSLESSSSSRSIGKPRNLAVRSG